MKTETTTLVSPYAATKILNEILTGAGLNPIPPQMMYQYAKKGYISSQVVNGKILFDTTDTTTDKGFGAWSVKYLAKKGITVDTETE